MSVVEASIKEYRVYATCMFLDEMSLKLINETWNKSRNEALRNLKSNGTSLLILGRFTLATVDSKILDTNMNLSEAMPYCYKNWKNLDQFFEYGQSRFEK